MMPRKLADGVEVSASTVRSWLSILESSYIAFELMPYHTNVRKRLTKTPKLYFHDIGLLCHLLGIGSLGEMLGVPETDRYVVARIADSFQARGAQAVSAADWLRR